MIALGALYGLVTVWSQPFTSAVLGVVVAMIASIAVNEPTPGRRAGSIALLVPAAAATASLAAALSPHQVVADAVFVVVAVGAVFLRLLGPRGMAMGMIGFIAYFLALFLQVTVAQLPVVIVSAAVGALVAFAVGVLLRPRHPDRDLLRMVAALGVRAGSVLDALSKELDGASTGSRPGRRLSNDVAASGETALMVEQRLDSTEEPLLEGVDNDALSIRIFDFQLDVERLAAVGVQACATDLPAPTRKEIAATLKDVGAALQEGTGARSAARTYQVASDLTAGIRRDGRGLPDEELGRLLRVLQNTVTGWSQIVDPQPDDAAGPPGAPTPDGPTDGANTEDENTADAHAEEEDDEGGDDDSSAGRRSDTARQAVQVGLAAALAIVAGELISSTRWYWSAIAAFVVFTGTSTRGEILSKGWQRVIGTLVGVGVGVVVATLVGGNTVAALLLIVVSLFLGIYLMRLSSGWMMFFITIMLALLYGLLGQFSVGLLLTRLEETAAGAGIGVLVSFLVLPSSTRGAVRSGAANFLTDLGGLLDHLGTTLVGERSAGAGAQGEAGALRESFDAMKSTAEPLTSGLAGLDNRSGYQRVLQILGACEHHARTLARLADTAAGAAAAPDLCSPLLTAVHSVRDNVDALAGAVDQNRTEATMHPADDALDALDLAIDRWAEHHHDDLSAVSRHVRAIDRAVCRLATDRGASTQPLRNGR